MFLLSYHERENAITISSGNFEFHNYYAGFFWVPVILSWPESLDVCLQVELKRLHYKELPSRLVGLSFHCLDALSLFLLKISGTIADNNWRERK